MVRPVAATREWLLVAPWYRWRRQGVPASRTPRETRPVFQKYDTGDLVNAFLADPQRSLRFLPDDDLVTRVAPPPPPPELPPLPADPKGVFTGRKRRLSDTYTVPTGIRKLYLDTHKRFYLVVCELHCDAPGFPSARRDDVCEAGFVIRRRRAECPPEDEQQAARILAGVADASAELAQLDRLAAERVADGDGAAGWPRAARVALGRTRAAAAERLWRQRQALRAWAATTGVGLATDGWMPSPFDRVGAWQQVPDRPETLTEAPYPLYPLEPDPGARDHAGQGVSIYFGIVPTGGAETAADGTARFDDRSLYEVRCFVRRHRPQCPRTGGRNDCNGPLTWSRPTECYQLAAHFDLKGTANRPVTIRQPDLPALQAQAAGLAAGQGAAVTFAAPPGSSFSFKTPGKLPERPGDVELNQGEEVCSFAIPLIMLVATFVFNLFLPIVVFLLNLWFLLRLKFCVPPSAEVGANLTAELALLPDGIADDRATDLDLAVAYDLQNDLQDRLKLDFDAELGAGAGARLTGDFTNNVLVRLHQDMATGAAVAGALTAGLAFEEPERRSEVLPR
jgi:hypothetical protein